MKYFIKTIFAVLICLTCYAKAVEKAVADSYRWKVARVIDGDTFEVNAMFYPKELGNINVRVKGIDTPEKGSRAKCPEENALAQKASAFTKSVIEGKIVTIENVEADKYGGRIVADVIIDRKKLSDMLIARGLAMPYNGGTKQSWCSSVSH